MVGRQLERFLLMASYMKLLKGTVLLSKKRIGTHISFLQELKLPDLSYNE